nr:hypothetical protein [Escherichia coli]
MHEKNIALLCDEADRLLQLNINLLRQMVEEPDVLSDVTNGAIVIHTQRLKSDPGGNLLS